MGCCGVFLMSGVCCECVNMVGFDLQGFKFHRVKGFIEFKFCFGWGSHSWGFVCFSRPRPLALTGCLL